MLIWDGAIDFELNARPRFEHEPVASETWRRAAKHVIAFVVERFPRATQASARPPHENES